jgi:hypothetical protein
MERDHFADVDVEGRKILKCHSFTKTKALVFQGQ